METPASADCLATLPRRESDSGCSEFAGHESRKDGCSDTPGGGVGGAMARGGGARQNVATRVGQGHPRVLYTFPLFFPLFSFPLSTFFGGKWGEEGREAPLERYGSSWVAAGDAGRGYD